MRSSSLTQQSFDQVHSTEDRLIESLRKLLVSGRAGIVSAEVWGLKILSVLFLLCEMGGLHQAQLKIGRCTRYHFSRRI